MDCCLLGREGFHPAVQLVWEVIAEIPAKKRQRPVFVVGNDTLVESP